MRSLSTVLGSLVSATLCLSISVTQAQESPESLSADEMFSSAVLHTIKAKSAASLSGYSHGGSYLSMASPAGLNVGSNVRVSDPFDPTPGADLRGRSETTIASDPSGQFLLSGWNDAQGFLFAPFGPLPGLGLSGFAFSGDGGKTWTDGGAPFVFGGSPGVVTLGDPWMDTGGPGEKTYYYANLAVLESFPFSGGISVHRGKFRGKNFAFKHAVFIPAPAPGNFLDKESLCAGKNNKIKDQVVVPTTNFLGAGGTQIDVFVSTDRGTSFPATTIAQPADGRFHQGTDCVIAKDGKLHVVWELDRGTPFFGPGPPEIVIASAANVGAAFSARTTVSGISSGSLFPPGGYNRQTHNDFPRIAVANDGPFKGRIYVVYNDSRIANGGPQPAPLGPEDVPVGVDIGHWDLDVYLSFSDDKGATWSTPTLVAGGGDGIIQFWPVVSSDANGRVNVTWNQSVETTIPDFINGDGLGTSLVDVFWSDSVDGGTSFSVPTKVTSVTTDWGATPTNIAPNFGDYISHVSKSNRVMVTWADGRSGVQPEVFYATILPKP